jgi:hypothetical protein
VQLAPAASVAAPHPPLDAVNAGEPERTALATVRGELPLFVSVIVLELLWPTPTEPKLTLDVDSETTGCPDEETTTERLAAALALATLLASWPVKISLLEAEVPAALVSVTVAVYVPALVYTWLMVGSGVLAVEPSPKFHE